MSSQHALQTHALFAIALLLRRTVGVRLVADNMIPPEVIMVAVTVLLMEKKDSYFFAECGGYTCASEAIEAYALIGNLPYTHSGASVIERF
ncbi:hypothetical protein L915_07918 [Phytophthora nicotianae]|uniref:Uncharacterized protein n=1 Tax=Phytophthora nicotianae TaxID=4792 RepID=W2NFW5_PHYNI|nr:hypothetical protein L915_07918 [Phytophthora nicotianae]ETM47491.1 hypothetical protein L914_07806 [Phytophthora nicotianae]